MANPKRTSSITVMIEYLPNHYDRTSNIALMVEYKPTDMVRFTNIGVMIEYHPFVYVPVINGPKVQSNN